MKAVIYARESSADTTKAPSIQEQINRARDYANEQGFELVKTYSDNGYSGGNWNRPDWRQLVKDAKFHKFNIVIVWNTDRIARDTEQFLWFNRNMKSSSVGVHSLSEGEITLDSVGDSAKNISLAMASELFRKNTSDKVRKTYESKKAKAEKKGQKIRWGRKPKDVDVDKVKELRDQGLGFRKISKRLGCSSATVWRVLKNSS